MEENRLILEVGTEEIPAKYMSGLIQQLNQRTKQLMEENRIGIEEINCYGTPRRLVLSMKGIAKGQQDLNQLVKGPSKKAAFTEDGEPTKAAKGFAGGQGVRIEDLIVKEMDNGTYVYAKKTIKGIPSEQVLKTVLPQIIGALSFNTSMRWGTGEFRFIRPIRWLLALYNDSVIEFELGGIKSGRVTRGHRFLGRDNIEVSSADVYLDILKDEHVIVDQDIRKEMILLQSQKLATSLNGNIIKADKLLEEVTYLIEYPTALYGSFDERYLRLPKEVVTTPMKEHQRYFPIVDIDNNLLPYFITIRNGSEEYIDIVREGNVKVLEARLADAEFFYDEDKDKPLEDNVEKLKSIVYLEKLGTLYDKTMRIKKVACFLADEIHMDEKSREALISAAHLCKCDLVTDMVNEFDELQGVMGREYALLQGKEPDVAQAIYEHYLPRFSGDSLPTSMLGIIISIADRIDSITGCFYAGFQPTGSQDPYALRRQAIGIINIVKNKGIRLSLQKLICISIDSIKKINNFDLEDGEEEQLSIQIKDFFEQRVRNILIDTGIRYDVVEAVLSVGFDDLCDVFDRCNVVMKCLGDERFEAIVASLNRVNNIIKNNQWYKVDENLLLEDSEIRLWSSFSMMVAEVDLHLEKYKDDYFNVIMRFDGMVESIENFFETTMVNVDDELIRNNRLGLLNSIMKRIKNILDISKLVM